MNKKRRTVKTTIELDPRLLQMAKLKALHERKTLKEIISQCLAKELGMVNKKSKKRFTIGGYKLGGVKGSLRRIDLYEDF